MQFFAWEDGNPIAAVNAEKQRDYRCPECNLAVRLRSGPHRQPHFYHIQSRTICRQHQKSAEHLQAQLALVSLFPTGECRMERPFPTIGRIADIFWESEKIVFEVQCSPLSRDEAEARCRDYQALSLKIVWILHEKTFNRRRLSAAESYLREQTCYYTNLSSSGAGCFYDQFDICYRGTRLFKGPALTVRLDSPRLVVDDANSSLPTVLQQRLDKWVLSFHGDLFDRWKREKDRKAAALRIRQIEERFLTRNDKHLPLTTFLRLGYRRLLVLLNKSFCVYF